MLNFVSNALSSAIELNGFKMQFSLFHSLLSLIISQFLLRFLLLVWNEDFSLHQSLNFCSFPKDMRNISVLYRLFLKKCELFPLGQCPRTVNDSYNKKSSIFKTVNWFQDSSEPLSVPDV